MPGYKSSIDLLTRFGEGSDFASDVCIRKDGSDAEGCRYLEEVAFEVVSTQTRRHMTIRAEDMTRRGGSLRSSSGPRPSKSGRSPSSAGRCSTATRT